MAILNLDRNIIAKYPFLEETKAFLRRWSNYDVSELAKPENTLVVQRAKERIVEAIQHANVSNKSFDREIEILSFHLALLLVRATNLEHLMSRYTFAEAIRVESLLKMERMDELVQIFQKVTNIEPLPISTGSYHFRLLVEEYLKRATAFHTPEWKLVNRVLDNGYVYVKKWELVRLIREETMHLIHSRLHTLQPIKLPEEFQPIIDELIKSSPVPYDTGEEITATPDKYPPCLVKALDLLQTGQNVPHYGRFLMTTYLLTIGKSANEIIQLYPKVPDFNERITRYQVEHIAGIRGGRVRYKVPSCKTIATHNFCFRTEACGSIINPLHFGRQKTEPRKKRKVARKDSGTP